MTACDFCGKELETWVRTRLVISRQPYAPDYPSQPFVIKMYDVCPECVVLAERSAREGTLINMPKPKGEGIPAPPPIPIQVEKVDEDYVQEEGVSDQAIAMTRRKFFRRIAGTIATVALWQGIVRTVLRRLPNPAWETAPIELGIRVWRTVDFIETPHPIQPYLRLGYMAAECEPLFDQRYVKEGKHLPIRYTADLKPVEPFIYA